MPDTMLQAFTPNGPSWMEVRHREVKWQGWCHKAESPCWDMNSGLEEAHLYCERLRLRDGGGGGGAAVSHSLCAYPYPEPLENPCALSGRLWRLHGLP